MALIDLYNKAKKKVTDTVAPIEQKAVSGLNSMYRNAKSYMNTPVQRGGVLDTIDSGMRSFSQKAQNVPKFSFDDNTTWKTPVKKVITSIAQPIANIPSRTISGAFKDYGVQPTVSNVVKRSAEAANIGLDIGGMFGGGSTAKNLVQQGFKTFTPTTATQAIKQGAKTGFKQGLAYGGASGAFSGLQEGDNLKDQFKNAGRSALEGATIGGVAGGALGGAIPYIGHNARLAKNEYGLIKKDIENLRNPYSKRIVEMAKETPDGWKKAPILPNTTQRQKQTMFYGRAGQGQARANYNTPERVFIDTIKQPFVPQSATGKFMMQPKAGMSIDDVTKKYGEDYRQMANDALKYKTSEEFINGQGDTFYHGTNEKFDTFDANKARFKGEQGANLWGNGFYVSPDEGTAKQYGKYLMELVGKPKKPLNLQDFKTIQELADHLDMSEDALMLRNGIPTATGTQASQMSSHAGYQGYDSIFSPIGKGELVVLDPSLLKTKPQLEDIHNLAHKPSTFEPQSATFKFLKNPKAGLGIEDVRQKKRGFDNTFNDVPFEGNPFIQDRKPQSDNLPQVQSLAPQGTLHKSEALALQESQPILKSHSQVSKDQQVGHSQTLAGENPSNFLENRSYTKNISQIPQKIKQGFLNTVDYSQKERPNMLKRAFISGERALQNAGDEGKQLKSLIEKQQLEADLKIGKYNSLIQKETNHLNKEQNANLADVLEGKAQPIDDVVVQSSQNLRNWLNSVQQEAVDTGLNTGHLDNYFPRKYNWDELTKESRKKEIIKHMVETGQADTPAKAEQLLKDYISKNIERKAGNLEYERKLDIPGYERDPKKALSMYAQGAARRITEAQNFGKKDEEVNKLINKIAEGGGDDKEAQKVFDLMYKHEDKNVVADALLTYNVVTKLSLGFFSNLTQSINTATKAGGINTIKGMGQALAQGVRAFKGTGYDDIATLANTLDDVMTTQETGVKNAVTKGSMYLFGKIEDFNRRVASNAGALHAQDLAKQITQDPQSKYAVRQLRSLGLDVNDIINGKLTEEQLLTAANKMVRSTQFKIDAMSLPTMWRSPLGKVLTQFKSFLFMQTKFVRNEIINESRQGNFKPLVMFLAMAPIASYVTQSARNYVNNAKSGDFRAGDLFAKAVGTMPTDFASQMQYAWEKQHQTYQDSQGTQHPSTNALEDTANYLSPFIGPTGGDAVKLAGAIANVSSTKEKNDMWYKNHPAAQRDPYLDIKRWATQKIPYVGRNLTNTFLPYEKSMAKQAKEVLQQGIAEGDAQKIQDAIDMDPYLQRKGAFQNAVGKKVKEMAPTEKEFYDKFKAEEKARKYAEQGKEVSEAKPAFGIDSAEASTKDYSADIEKLKNSEDNMLEVGDMLLMKDSSGKVQKIPKPVYEQRIRTQKMITAKKEKNLKEWSNLAQVEYAHMKDQLKDEKLDELSRVKIEGKMKTLQEQFSKYSNQKGFTKGRKSGTGKAKKEKKVAYTPITDKTSASRIVERLNVKLGKSRKPRVSMPTFRSTKMTKVSRRHNQRIFA